VEFKSARTFSQDFFKGIDYLRNSAHGSRHEVAQKYVVCSGGTRAYVDNKNQTRQATIAYLVGSIPLA
jgi:hypothetical protein